MRNPYVGLQHTVFDAGYRAALKHIIKVYEDDPGINLPMSAPMPAYHMVEVAKGWLERMPE